MRSILLSAAVLLCTAGAAHAQSLGSATLQSPYAGSERATIIDGAQWRCEGQTCTTRNAGEPQPALRACKRFVARMGAVSAFTYNRSAVSAEQLAECNARARRA